MAKILNPESAALQNRIKEAAFRLLHLPDFKYSPESLEQYCTVTDEKIEFSRSNTKEYFKKALIDLRIEGLEEAEEYAAARIVDAIEEETAYNKAVSLSSPEASCCLHVAVLPCVFLINFPQPSLACSLLCALPQFDLTLKWAEVPLC